MRFSKVVRTFWAFQNISGTLSGVFSRVPKGVSQNTRKCPEMSPDIFGNLFDVTIMRLELRQDTLFNVVNMLSHTTSLQKSRGKKMMLK